MSKQKPDHLPFLEAIGRINVKPESILYVGDHPFNDIKPANEMGMDTLWIDHLNKNNIPSTYKITEPDKLASTIASL